MRDVHHAHPSIRPDIPGDLTHTHDGGDRIHEHEGFGLSPAITPVITPDETVLVTFVLDRSGSMVSCWDATITGFNEFKNDQARQPGRTLFSLTTFNTEVNVEHKVTDVGEIPDLDRHSYHPDGMTALYDAVAYTIRNLESKLAGMQEKPTRNLFVIMTDGEENSSKEWTRDTLFDLIKEKEAAGWDFVYLGANQDAYAVASSIGVAAGNTSGYVADAAGTQAAFASVMTSTRSYRSGESDRGSFFDQGSRPTPITSGTPATPQTRTPKTRGKKTTSKPVSDLTGDNSL